MKASILNDEFFNNLDSSILPIEEAETLPPFCYTSDEFYEFEKEAVFNSEWRCVGRVSQLDKPGDYFTTSIVGEPLIVCRDLKGELHAMSAVCRHRAMLVAEGNGNTAGYLRFNGTLHSDASFNATQKAILPIFPKLTKDDRKQLIFANIPPSLSLVLTSEMVIYLIVRATGPETNEMDVGELVAPGAKNVPGFSHLVEMIDSAARKIMA